MQWRLRLKICSWQWLRYLSNIQKTRRLCFKNMCVFLIHVSPELKKHTRVRLCVFSKAHRESKNSLQTAHLFHIGHLTYFLCILSQRVVDLYIYIRTYIFACHICMLLPLICVFISVQLQLLEIEVGGNLDRHMHAEQIRGSPLLTPPRTLCFRSFSQMYNVEYC